MISRRPPVALIIMDGWGVTAPSVGNAVTSANLKYWDYLLNNYPSTLLQASGAAVGLPWGVMGNSEVGHLTIGSGRIYLQSLDKINKSISDGSFFENKALVGAMEYAKKNNKSVHLMGVLGEGGVHAHQGHLIALLEMTQKNEIDCDRVFLHLFTDGRDSARDAGMEQLVNLKEDMKRLKCGKIASIGGRFYGMDRNNNWDRVQIAYDVMTGSGEMTNTDPVKALEDSYNNNIFDEEMIPVMIVGDDGKPVGQVEDGDVVIFYNFRADRARQISHAFVDEGFKEFERKRKLKDLYYVGFSEYEKDLKMKVVFDKIHVDNPLAKIVSEAGLRQLHVAETEKYAHVTFFINGLRQEKFEGEDRVLVPSPSVESYAEKPEMSAMAVKDAVMDSLNRGGHDLIIVNFANPDMVGHTGDLNASVRAVETVSKCLEDIVEKIVRLGGRAIITADHGNVEEIINLETRKIDKEHSNFPVPVVLANGEWQGKISGIKNIDLYNLKTKGALVDIAPTVLSFLGLPKSNEMIGIDLGKMV